MTTSYQPSTLGQWTERPAAQRTSIAGSVGAGYAEIGCTVLLYLVLAAMIDQTLLPQPWPLAVTISMGAFSLGLLMAYSRFDALFALAYSLFVGLAWVVGVMAQVITPAERAELQWLGQPEVARIGALWQHLRHWWLAVTPLPERTQTVVFFLGLALLLWWITYLGVWAILRHGYVWSSVVLAGLVLALASRWIEHLAVGWVVLFCGVALLLLIQSHLRERRARWRARQVYVQPTIQRHFLLTGLGFGLIVLAVAWVTPTLEPSTWVQWLLGRVPVPTGLNCRLGSCRPTTLGHFGEELVLIGPRQVDDTPVLEITTLGKRYWRSVVFDSYDGQRWSSSAATAQDFAADRPLPSTQWSQPLWLTQTITVLLPGQTTVVGVPVIHQVSLPVVAQAQPVTAAGEPEILRLDLAQPLQAQAHYTVISHLPAATAADLTGAGEEYPPAIRDRYLQLPAAFSARIATTALTVTQTAATPYAKAQALETFLRSYRYDDQIAGPPAGVDPIEYFLYAVQAGYCDYFASAMVVMLRSLGIPARVVSGYAQGEQTAATDTYLVRNRHAHTWVEVFFPNIGWVEFEPTANQPVASALPPAPEVASVPVVTAPPALTVDPEPAPEQPAIASVAQRLAQWLGRVAWARIVGLLALGLLLMGLYQWRAQRCQAQPALPALLYLRLLQWAMRLGVPLRQGDTPYEQARQLARRVPAGRQLIQALVEGYVHSLFGRKGPLNQPLRSVTPEQAHLRQVWRQLRPLLWRAWAHQQVRFFHPL